MNAPIMNYNILMYNKKSIFVHKEGIFSTTSFIVCEYHKRTYVQIIVHTRDMTKDKKVTTQNGLRHSHS